MLKAQEILTSHDKFHITLGLDRIKKILEILGNPENKYKIIHVAGTNGKGSTSKIINEILIEHFKNTNTKVGLFTSPHLFSYTERMRVNNIQISDYIFDKLVLEVDNLAKKNNIDLSEFELITAVGFYYFYIKNVSYVVLEVGLGGLYDATNVILNSTSVITSIDFDHTERLGKTIDEIATQKAGIIKNNSNVIVSKDNLGYQKIAEIAKQKGAKILDLPDVYVEYSESNYAYINNKKYRFNLLGKHQARNLQLAIGLIKSLDLNISDKTIEKALNQVHWDFRLDYKKDKNILIDSCHNPSGICTLREFLDDNYKNQNITYIFGCLKNKDYKKMLEILKPESGKFYFYEFDYPNALKYDELNNKNAIRITSLDEIEKIISEEKNLKVFCGSIYMLGKIFSEIKL